MRWNILDVFRELAVCLDIDRLMLDDVRCRVLAQVVVIPPVVFRPVRTRAKTAATIRTDILQHRIDTAFAKRTLVAADHRLGRIWW